MSDRETVSTLTPINGAGEKRKALRAELEGARAEFHALLSSLSAADWKRKSSNPAWNVGQLMAHVANGYSVTPSLVARARTGKGAFNAPPFLLNPFNVLITRWGARKATRRSVAEQFDRSHADVLRLLDTMRDDELQRGARLFNRFITVEGVLHTVAEHVQEHGEQVKQGLVRG